MGLNIVLKGKSEAVLEVMVNEENISAPPFSGQKVPQSATNYKGDNYFMKASATEQTLLSSRNEDVEVNITECTNSRDALMAEDTCEDATECSSSFGDTGSGIESSAFSEDEVMSHMYTVNPFSSMYRSDCEPSLIRKKKLTIHWRRFICPLMWRCKWIELKLKQLQSQALKYEKELAAYDYRRQHVFTNYASDGFNTKSVPLSGQIHGKKVMKRKKRKRVEETCNLVSYMSDHNVFSYYENRDPANGAFLKDFSGVAINNADNYEEFKWNDLLSSHKDSDKSLENIIQKIEAVQSQVHKLRTRIDKLVEKTKESLVEQKSTSLQSSLNAFSASKLNVSWSTRRARQRSGSQRQRRR